MMTLTRIATLTALSFVAAAQAAAATNIYLKIDGVKGEAIRFVDNKIPIEGAGISVAQVAGGTGWQGDLFCSPGACLTALEAAAKSGRPISMKIIVEDVDGDTAIKTVYELKNVMVTSITKVASAREAGSGLATGKRQHKPLVFRCTFNAASVSGVGPRASKSAKFEYIPVKQTVDQG